MSQTQIHWWHVAPMFLAVDAWRKRIVAILYCDRLEDDGYYIGWCWIATSNGSGHYMSDAEPLSKGMLAEERELLERAACKEALPEILDHMMYER